MNFVIPMAGRGSRFKKQGFELPKFLITTRKKTLLEYSLKSLPLSLATKIIFIALEEHLKEFRLIQFIRGLFEKEKKKLEFIGLKEVTRGQAETVLQARELINNDKDLLIYNIDSYFYSSSLKQKLRDPQRKQDGILGAFEATGEQWSFAKLNTDGYIEETSEKIPISKNALTGLYHFSRGHDFIEMAKYFLNNDLKTKGEFYIAPMYNYLIQQGKKFVLDLAETFIPLGTPEDIEQFETGKYDPQFK